MKLRHSKPGDVIELVGQPFECSFKGLTLVDGEQIVAMTGVMLSSPITLFLNVSKDVDARKYLRPAVWMMKELQELLKTIDAPVYARANPDFETSTGLIEHAGFERVNEEVFRWTRQH